jgi:predicted nuclease of predicted toxin-antitoxin system
LSLKLYADVHVRRAISVALRMRGVDLLTAQADGAAELEDPELLDRASGLGRVLFTQDEDLLTEGVRRQRIGESFAGIIYAHQLRVTIGQCINDLELIAKVYDPADIAGRIEHLPLK